MHQSPYNFSENAVVNARELEGLEKVLIFGSRAAAAGAAAPVSPRTGVYTELKRHTQNSLRFWAGAADKNYNIIRASGMVGIALANRVLNSEDDKNSGDKKSAENKNGQTKSPSEERAERLNKKQRPGKDFTKAGKDVVKDLNREKK